MTPLFSVLFSKLMNTKNIITSIIVVSLLCTCSCCVNGSGTSAEGSKAALSVSPDAIAETYTSGQCTPESQQNKGHEFYMRRAIALAQKSPDFPFGAVIVRRESGEIVAEGFNRTHESPVFHGEIDAINRCAQAHPSIKWEELDLYTTAEPCPMCQSAIEWAGISRVYYGSSIPYLKSQGWWQIDIRAEEIADRTPFRNTRVIGGILEEECNALYKVVPKSTFNR